MKNILKIKIIHMIIVKFCTFIRTNWRNSFKIYLEYIAFLKFGCSNELGQIWIQETLVGSSSFFIK